MKDADIRKVVKLLNTEQMAAPAQLADKLLLDIICKCLAKHTVRGRCTVEGVAT